VTWEGELVVSAFVAAEADYLILTRLGVDAQVAFVEDLASAYLVEALDSPGLRQAAGVCSGYRDLELGLADASMVVLADRWSTHCLATFDERDFRAVSALDGGTFDLRPPPSARRG
jgi:predicted nucleic acid-binding protein